MTNTTPGPRRSSRSKSGSAPRSPSGNAPKSLGGDISPDDIPLLGDDVPVTMPDLPPRLVITTAEQFKAIAEPTRSRILGIIQNQPATAKQIADRLRIAPGAAGHHLQVLEAAGLAQIVARRIVRGIIAKYYARTARIFMYQMSPDVTAGSSPTMDVVTSAVRELAESEAEGFDESKDGIGINGFPRARLSPERARIYAQRLDAIMEDLLNEPPDPDGDVYGILVAMFRSPSYMQGPPSVNPIDDADKPVRDDREGGER